MRRAKSSGHTFNGRSRRASSDKRTMGITPVARHGRSSFTSLCHATSCCSRSASSWKRRTLKKEDFTKPTRFSTVPFCWGLCGQHNSTPMPIQHGVGEDRIPFRHLAVPAPLQRYGFRSVEHAEQRNTASTIKMLGQVADQTLHRLVLHEAHAHVPGVFQTGSKEVDPAYRSIEEFDVDLPEIVLAELPG